MSRLRIALALSATSLLVLPVALARSSATVQLTIAINGKGSVRAGSYHLSCATAGHACTRYACFSMMQKANKKMVSEVRQVLGACLPDKNQAHLLHCDTREALLRIQRWYHAADGTLLEMSDTLHPPSRFQYVMTLRHALKNGSPPVSKANQ